MNTTMKFTTKAEEEQLCLITLNATTSNSNISQIVQLQILVQQVKLMESIEIAP